jgi:hypothetical protein
VTVVTLDALEELPDRCVEEVDDDEEGSPFPSAEKPHPIHMKYPKRAATATQRITAIRASLRLLMRTGRSSLPLIFALVIIAESWGGAPRASRESR